MHTLTDTEFSQIFPFDYPRNNQRELINRIINAYDSGKKYVILNAPTGIGKSVIGYSVARWYGSSYILTSQKVLQQQYFNDFNIPFVLGRSNYKCRKNNAITCEFGVCLGMPKHRCKTSASKISCPYLMAKEKCFNAMHSNLNYSYFLSAISLIVNREIIICDECHNLESELINHCSLKIDEKLLKSFGIVDISLPNKTISDIRKCNWLFNDLFEKVKSNFLFLLNQLQQIKELKNTKEYRKISSRFTNMQRILETVKLMKSTYEKNEQIVITQNENNIEFKLLHSNIMFNTLLNEKSNRFLFMSASILDHKTFIKDLDLDESLVEYIECDSVFPIKNRLIHFTPVGSMSFKTKENTLPLLTQKIDKILKENNNVKGIIHTVNYDVAEKLIDNLAFSSESYRLIMPRGANKQDLLNAFYNSEKPYILISPSLTEGIDLKEDLSRLCIICKVPYANLTDKWTQLRMKENQRWYISQACMHLVQMTGRSIRSENDYAKTYILDSDFMKLAEQSLDIFPKWWKDAVTIS